jgi:hypothetical protein
LGEGGTKSVLDHCATKENPVGQARKPKRNGAARAAETGDGEPEQTLANPHAHLIRIADAEARKRAITALGEAREPYCGFTDYRLLVTDEHLDVLRKEAIPFEVLS